MPYIRIGTEIQPVAIETGPSGNKDLLCKWTIKTTVDWFFDDIDVSPTSVALQSPYHVMFGELMWVELENSLYSGFIVRKNDIKDHQDHPDYVKMAMKYCIKSA